MPCEGLVRGPPGPFSPSTLPGPPLTTDLLWDGVALSDDSPRLVGGHGGAVCVSEDVGGAPAQDPPGALGELRSDHGQGLGVHRPLVDHLVVVDGGELGVLRPGDLPEPERFSYARSGRKVRRSPVLYAPLWTCWPPYTGGEG